MKKIQRKPTAESKLITEEKKRERERERVLQLKMKIMKILGGILFLQQIQSCPNTDNTICFVLMAFQEQCTLVKSYTIENWKQIKNHTTENLKQIKNYSTGNSKQHIKNYTTENLKQRIKNKTWQSSNWIKEGKLSSTNILNIFDTSFNVTTEYYKKNL